MENRETSKVGGVEGSLESAEEDLDWAAVLQTVDPLSDTMTIKAQASSGLVKCVASNISKV